MDWAKPTAELIKAFAHLAWPIFIPIIVWWFRKEIKILIERGFDFEGFGLKIKADAANDFGDQFRADFLDFDVVYGLLSVLIRR